MTKPVAEACAVHVKVRETSWRLRIGLRLIRLAAWIAPIALTVVTVDR